MSSGIMPRGFTLVGADFCPVPAAVVGVGGTATATKPLEQLLAGPGPALVARWGAAALFTREVFALAIAISPARVPGRAAGGDVSIVGVVIMSL
jgi:hypothetical protein